MKSRELPKKVRALYKAVVELFLEGADLNNLTVSEIAAKAGIGKGTVYEYFSNKEEMIAGALFFEMKSACQQMYDRIREEKGLYNRMDLLLTSMERELTEVNCILRALHIMMDHSALSLRLRKLAEEKDEGDMLFVDLVRRIAEEETEDLGELEEKDKAYLVMVVLSRIVCFAMYQLDPIKSVQVDSKTMREMICQGVCQDVENFRAEKTGCPEIRRRKESAE